MQLSAICVNFTQHKNVQALHTLKNTGFKTTQFGLIEHILGLILPSKLGCLFNPS